MKKFLIKVNGNQYEVEVEEIRDGSAATEAVTYSAPEAKPAPAASPAPVPAAAPKKDSTGAVGATKVTAPMPGTILGVKVNPGDTVKKGQVLLILEAMKMENEIVAPVDGTIATVNVSKGTSVNAGDLLVSMN